MSWMPGAGWLGLWGVDRDGSGTCRCRAGERCDRPGKHPWWVKAAASREVVGWVRGTRQAVGSVGDMHRFAGPCWTGAVGRGEGRLGRACGPEWGLVVLDFDGEAGIRALLRMWDTLVGEGSVGKARLVKTPRGVHALVSGGVLLEPVEAGGWGGSGSLIAAGLVAAGVRSGVDVKGKGSYIVWPTGSGEGDARRLLGEQDARECRRRWGRLWPGVEFVGKKPAGVGWPWEWRLDGLGRQMVLQKQEQVVVTGLRTEVGELRRQRYREMVGTGSAQARMAGSDVKMGRAEEGNRNALLNTLGYHAREYTGDGEGQVSTDEWQWRIGSTAIRVGLGEGEVRRTLRSGLGLGREW